MGKVISIALPKGGVGKTTTVVNLAASLAVAEKRVLIIDLDPSGSAGIALGFSEDERMPGIFDIFSYTHSVDSRRLVKNACTGCRTIKCCCIICYFR